MDTEPISATFKSASRNLTAASASECPQKNALLRADFSNYKLQGPCFAIDRIDHPVLLFYRSGAVSTGSGLLVESGILI